MGKSSETHHPAAAMHFRCGSGTRIGKEGMNRESAISLAQQGTGHNRKSREKSLAHVKDSPCDDMLQVLREGVIA